MEYITKQIKEGVKVHYIKTDLYKTDLISVFITKKLERESVTTNTLIPAVLSRGSKTMPTQEDISKSLENLYGAEYNSGIDKTGDNHVMKFYIESLNNEFLISQEDILQQSIEKLLQIVFEPLIEDESFKKEYVELEKNKIKQLIESKIDNKDKYATERCVEEVYKGKAYGLYKYGYVEDLDKIDEHNLYDAYKKLISDSKIDIFISGNFDENAVNTMLENNHIIQQLQPRTPQYIINNETTEKKEKQEIKEVIEQKNVGQGKLVIGLDVFDNTAENRYILALYNTLLGGSANSKLFQNVREKESLAYSIGSIYIRQKNNVFIKAGINIEDYDKTVQLIKQQLEDMENGNFTEEELEKAKKLIVNGIRAIIDEQETGVTYYLGQELARENITPEQYIEKINNITKQQVQDISGKININTIYFLKN